MYLDLRYIVFLFENRYFSFGKFKYLTSFLKDIQNLFVHLKAKISYTCNNLFFYEKNIAIQLKTQRKKKTQQTPTFFLPKLKCLFVSHL